MPNHGRSLLECLVTLALSSVMLGSISIAGSRISALTVEVTKRAEIRAKIAAALMSIHSALRCADSHRLPFGVVLSLPGQRLSNGLQHPVMDLAGTSAPRTGSQIISVIDLASEYAAVVQETSRQDGRFIFRCCWAREHPTALDYRSYLILSPSGFFQMTGDATVIDTDCISLDALPLNGIFTEDPPFNIGATSLVPVRREYSLLVDRTGVLRFVSHTGQHILENQPLTDGLRSIHVEHLPQTQSLNGYHITVKATGAPPVGWLQLNRLARISPWNEIFM